MVRADRCAGQHTVEVTEFCCPVHQGVAVPLIREQQSAAPQSQACPAGAQKASRGAGRRGGRSSRCTRAAAGEVSGHPQGWHAWILGGYINICMYVASGDWDVI